MDKESKKTDGNSCGKLLHTPRKVAMHYGEMAMIHGFYRNYTPKKPFKINAQIIIEASERGHLIELVSV